MPQRTPSDASAAILATALVPWDERHEFDEGIFRRQVRVIAAGLTRHIYIFGTAGEGYAITESQFDRIAGAFWESSQECDVAPMLGIISISLPTIIARIERGVAMGFRTFQLSLPAWGALNDREIDVFFAETCGRFHDCRFHHYNLSRTKRLLTSVDYRRIAAAHSNLVAVKAGTGDPAAVADLLAVAPRLRFYFTEMGYAIARKTHDVGLLISLASINYARAHAYVAGDDARRASDVAELNEVLAALMSVAGGRYHMDGAFDKMLVRFAIPEFPLRLLSPYQSATDTDFAQFRDRLPPGWAANGSHRPT